MSQQIRAKLGHLKCAGTLLPIALALAPQTNGEPIPIVNPSFESFFGPPSTTIFDLQGNLKDTAFSTPIYWSPSERNTRSGNPIPGWTATALGGTLNPATSSYSRIPDGQNIAWLDLRSVEQWALGDPAISQILCAQLTPGHYTLRCSIGRATGNVNYPGYRVQLRAGGVTIAEDDNTLAPAKGAFVVSEVNVDVPTNHLQLGEPIEIRLTGAVSARDRAEVDFDDVSLDGPTSHCQILANSVAEFSGQQGDNNWYYGYYNKTADPAPGYNPTKDFTPLPNFHGAHLPIGDNGSHLWNLSVNYWTCIGATFLMPNSDSSNSGLPTLREHWAIRRWISETNGFVRIHGRIAKMSIGGDGVTAKIMINGRSIYEREIAGTNSVGLDYNLGVDLKGGDLVDFALTDNANTEYDFTYFNSIIEPADKDLPVTTGPKSQKSCLAAR
jgi:hypothetical protein